MSVGPSRLARAVVTLLDASERASTRGHHAFASTYALKAAEAAERLRELAADAVTLSMPARRMRNSERLF